MEVSPLNRSLALLVALLLALAACDDDPGKGVAKAKAEAPAAAATAAAAGARYAFSNADSRIEFVGAKITAKHEGKFGAFTGTITMPAASPDKGAVTVDIETASLSTEEADLTKHLKSADFFDVAKMPKARFASTKITAGGEGGATHTVTGNLELHGMTKQISFPATIHATADTVDVDAVFAIDRKDFGLVYPGMPDDLIKDEVRIKLQIHAKKAG